MIWRFHISCYVCTLSLCFISKIDFCRSVNFERKFPTRKNNFTCNLQNNETSSASLNPLHPASKQEIRYRNCRNQRIYSPSPKNRAIQATLVSKHQRSPDKLTHKEFQLLFKPAYWILRRSIKSQIADSRSGSFQSLLALASACSRLYNRPVQRMD